jgi:hypothetical protein
LTNNTKEEKRIGFFANKYWTCVVKYDTFRTFEGVHILGEDWVLV